MRFSISLLTLIGIISIIGTVASWWIFAGLGVTTLAFIGVNMFLGGRNSYGTL